MRSLSRLYDDVVSNADQLFLLDRDTAFFDLLGTGGMIGTTLLPGYLWVPGPSGCLCS